MPRALRSAANAEHGPARSAAYTQKPAATAEKKPTIPKSNQWTAMSPQRALVIMRTALATSPGLRWADAATYQPPVCLDWPQWPICTAPPSFILRRASASGTATSEISIKIHLAKLAVPEENPSEIAREFLGMF
jgi:hypothetical protein